MYRLRIYTQIFIFRFQLLSYLHDVILKNEQNGNPVDAKLRKISDDLHSTVINHLQVGKFFVF